MPLKTLQTGKDKPYLTEGQKHAARRVGDLTRIYRDQYPNGLPHNDVGVKYSKYICRTMAFLPKDRRAHWLDRYAPWMDPEVRGGILDLGPYWYSPKSLGSRLELDNELREKLQAWTIEAFDINEEQRRMLNLEKDRQAQERRRRTNGAKPQAESLSRLKPWKSSDMSRAKFYRLPKETRDALVADLAAKARETTSSAPSLLIKTNDEPVSLSKVPETPVGTGDSPVSPSQPKGQTLAGSEVHAVSQQPQAAVVLSLAEYLARRKAAIPERRKPVPTPLARAA
jgi:hypothetical protein